MKSIIILGKTWTVTEDALKEIIIYDFTSLYRPLCNAPRIVLCSYLQPSIRFLVEVDINVIINKLNDGHIKYK